MENAIQNLKTLEGLDLSDFYAICLWNYNNEVALQGHITDKNLDIAKSLGIKLEVEEHFLRGYSTTKAGKIKIVLSTKD
jgi:hypothetical protein